MERKVDDALAQIGRRRRIVLSTPHFLVVPHLLLETPLTTRRLTPQRGRLQIS